MKLARWLGIGGAVIVALLLLARFVVAQPGVTPNNLRTEGSALGASTMLRAFGLDTNISITCQPKNAGSCILINPVISGFTPGSVIFAGAAGALSQDNGNFFYDSTAKALTVGDITAFVHAGPVGQIISASDGSLVTPGFVAQSIQGGQVLAMYSSRGTLSVPLALQASDSLGTLLWIGADSTNSFANGQAAFIQAFADGAPGAGSVAGMLSFGTTTTAAPGPSEKLNINNAGVVSPGATGTQDVGTTGLRWKTFWLTDIGTVVTTNRIFYPAMQFCKTDNLVVVLINTRVAANDWALSVTSAAGSTQNITCTFPLPFRTTASKGAKLTGLSIVSQIVTNNLTSNTFNALATTTYVNATANLVAAYGGAVTCTLPTVAQATPYVTACSIGTPAYMNTAAAQVSIDFTAVLAVAATTFRLYGVEATFETATY